MNQNHKWWQEAVIYQVYPRSFCDSDGDGIGDLKGVISKLDYIKDLGADAIWLSPVFKSPQDDNGYDISDYQDIDPTFGTLEDMMELLRQAKSRGIRIILDMVLNHTSDEHPWFKEARKSRDNPMHDWYVWRDGVPGTPPNGLYSCFGGSAWEWDENCRQYYLHQYSVKQPDLNWDNPKARYALYDMMNWWAERGAGGFRLDVIDSIAKEPDRMVTAEGTNLHKYVKEMSAAVLQGKDLVTVGEAWSANPERAKLWSNPDGSELSMVFQFEHIVLDQVPGGPKWDVADWKLSDLKRIMGKWQQELRGKGWNSLFWENHDLPRIVSRWGNDGRYREQSAKMLATILFGLQGTPYIYQGQELGMTNVRYELADYKDIEIRNMAAERLAAGYPLESVMASIYAKGRDNARTPMHWNDGENAGFTTGKPWLRIAPNYTGINAADQMSREDSVRSYYKKLIALRKAEPIFIDGDFEPLLEEREDVFAYRRYDGGKTLTVIANYTGENVHVPTELLEGAEGALIRNYDSAPQNGNLRPYEAMMILN